MAHTVFICHSSIDKLVADAACAALEAQRIPCWIAPRDVLAGDEYGKAIIAALSTCQIVLLIFSRHANDSAQVRREIERAASKEKIIVPFRIEDVLPSDAMEYALGNTHWLDAITPPMERRLGELCETISRLMQRETGSGPLWQPDPVGKKATVVQKPLPQGVPAPSRTQPSAEVKTAQAAVSEREDGSRGLPRWAWGVMAAVVLMVVFTAGRLFAPKPASGPVLVPQPQPVVSEAPTAPTPIGSDVHANGEAARADQRARDKAAQEARDQAALDRQQLEVQQQAAAVEQQRQQVAAEQQHQQQIAAEQQRQQQAAAELQRQQQTAAAQQRAMRSGIWTAHLNPFTLDFGPADACRWRLWITNAVVTLQFDESGQIKDGSFRYIYNESWIREAGKSCVSGVPPNSNNLLALANSSVTGSSVHAQFDANRAGGRAKPGAVATFDGRFDSRSEVINGELRLARNDLSASEAAWSWDIPFQVTLSH